MFCKSCGRKLADDMKFCDGCGEDLGEAKAPPVSPIAEQLKKEVKARSKDAWEGLKVFAVSPVGGLSESFKLFDDKRAISVGISFAIIFEVLFFIGLNFMKKKAMGMLGFLAYFMDSGKLTAGQLIKLIISATIPFVALALACLLARLIFRGRGRFSGDVYTAGAAMLPLGLFIFLAGLLGAANFEVMVILGLFMITYTILILYAGCSRIAGIPEIGAAPAVPIILIASAWLTKIIVVALWSSAS